MFDSALSFFQNFGLWPSLELASAILTGISVWLTTRRNIWAFPIGLVGVLAMAAVFFHSKWYGDAGLQIFFAAMQIHGWAAWRGGEKIDDSKVAVRRLDAKKWALSLVSLAVLAVGFIWFLDEKTDSPVPRLDGFLTAMSVVAQFLMNWRWLENWIFWIAADLIYAPALWSRDLKWLGILYAVFVGMAIFGFLEWRKKVRITH